MNNIIDSFVEVDILSQDNFLLICETLTRMGIASKKDKTLYQSVHCLHKRGKYYILSFKELFLLDNKPSTLTEEDKARRNLVALLLQEWGLVKILNEDIIGENVAPMSALKIIPHKEKDDWELVAKYSIGKRKPF